MLSFLTFKTLALMGAGAFVAEVSRLGFAAVVNGLTAKAQTVEAAAKSAAATVQADVKKL